MIRRFIAVTALLASLLPATAQVRQSGTVTLGHAAMWTANGVIQDAGTAALGLLTSLGVTNNGGPGICIRSAASGPYNQLCMSVSTAAAAQISLQNFGGATAQSLAFDINGTVSTFVTATGSFTANNVACFQSSIGILIDCGMTVVGGVVSNGTWHGTAVGVAFGGTGAVTAANARTNLGLSTMAVQDAATVTITGGTITGMPSPTGASDVAIKSYVDSLAAGLIPYPAMTLATTAVLPNTPTYANGASGVGATLTAGSNTTLTVDSTAAPLNTLVLAKDQASTFQNGFYYVSTAGSGAAAWVLTRCTLAACGKEFDTAATMLAGSYATVTSGTVNTGRAYVLAATVTTVGTTAATFNLFSNATAGVTTVNSINGAVTIVAGTGISVTPASSNITIANTLPARSKLPGDTNFYVRTDGNNTACTGLTNAAYVSGSFPQNCGFSTLQAIHNYIYTTYDCNSFLAIVNIAAGTYTAGLNVFGPPCIGTGPGVYNGIQFVGSGFGTIIATSAVPAILATASGTIVIGNVTVSSTSSDGMYSSGGGKISIAGDVNFNAAGGYYLHTNQGGNLVKITGVNLFWSANAQAAFFAEKDSPMEIGAGVITCIGSPTFSLGTAVAKGAYLVLTSGTSFSGCGGVVGQKFIAVFGGTVDTETGGNINLIPGSIAGNATQGYYNFLLKRDLNPAASDNTPMWLDKAA